MKKNQVNGIVLKVTEEFIVLMAENGTFKNVPRTSDKVPALGQRFTYIAEVKTKTNWLRYASIAAVFLLVFLSVKLFPFGQKESAYIVAIDINPSIEITADKNLQVISTKGLNEEGKELLRSIPENNLLVLVERLTNQAIEKGYLDNQDKSLITTTVIPLKDQATTVLKDIEKSINHSLQSRKVQAEVILAYESNELYLEAKKANLSVNYYKLYKDLKVKGIVKDIAEIKGKKINTLKQMEKELVNKPDLPQKPIDNKESSEKRNSKNIKEDPENSAVPVNKEEKAPFDKEGGEKESDKRELNKSEDVNGADSTLNPEKTETEKVDSPEPEPIKEELGKKDASPPTKLEPPKGAK